MSEQLQASKEENPSLLNQMLSVIGGSFSPILGVLAGSGLLSALLAVCTMFGWLSPESGTYAILSAAGHAVFYFLPIFLGITLSIKLGANAYVGGAIGAALLEPRFTSLLSEGADRTDFLGIPVLLMSYSSTVFPIFIAVSMYALLDRFLKKRIYKDIQMFINPLLSLLIIVPLTVILFGPIGVFAGEGIGAVIEWLSSVSGLLTGAVLGAAWNFLTLLGLHWAVIPIAIANLALGPDPIIGMAAAAPFALIGMSIGVLFRAKDRNLKTLAASGIVPSALAGTTEILTFGIFLRYKRTMVYVATAGAIGGAINGALGVKMAVFSLPSFLSIPAFTPIGSYLIGTMSALAAGFILTFAFGYEEPKPTMAAYHTGLPSVMTETLVSPMTGTVVPLSEFADPLFASETVGKGTAVEPENGKVYSPADGVVSVLFPTHHSIGITTKGGAEILIYIGVDTIKLNGAYFTSHVQQGDKVRQGDLLIEFDLESIKAAGYRVTTPIVITNSNQYADVHILKSGPVQVKEELIAALV